MKRKDFDYVDDDSSILYFFSSSRKARRLDGDSMLPVVIQEEPLTIAERAHDEQPFGSTCVVQSNGISSSEEKDIVPYNPVTAQLFKSTSEPGFSIVINSDLIPGLKDYLFGPGWLKKLSDAEDDVTEVQSSRTSSNCMAVVPWVVPRIPVTSETETQAPGLSEPMDAEDYEPEMMDIEEMPGIDGAGKAFELETNQGLQFWQRRQQQLQQQGFLASCLGNLTV